MILSLAPMEGITGHVFRRVHAECFGALDCYYTPFLPPPRVGNRFGGKASKEVDPANNQGLNVVPQLMSKNADEFVWAAQVLADMGYREVNLNLGCPSGTVVAKGKGSGFLRNLDELEVFLSDVCERSPLPVSVKTRLGLEDDGEYERVLDLYCRMPLAELIVHPRVQKDRYTGSPRKAFYGETLARAPFPVAYNGDIFDLEDMDALVEAYPGTRHVMLGRGLLTNPALARMVKGGLAATAAELQRFHDTLFAAYAEEIGGNAVFRMKEWWFYAKCAFADPATVHKLVRKTKKVDEYRAAVDRVFAVIDLKETIADKPAAKELPKVKGHVTFDHVSFEYKKGVPALSDVSLEVKPGQMIAFVGPSGAGKSTIANLIPRFYEVTSGSISIDGFDIRDVTVASLRGQIGIVPQETMLFSTTVRENIRYGRLDATDEEVEQAAKAANADGFIRELPNGYDTKIGERGLNLSGGQRQRMAIARAILKNPQILILDEATSALDTESEKIVQAALDKLMVGRTSFVIAHRLSTIFNADQIYVIDNGHIKEHGTHEELLKMGGLYSYLYNIQFNKKNA